MPLQAQVLPQSVENAAMSTLRITYCSADMDAASWIPGLKAAIPGAEVGLWEPGAPPADYAVVWKPPQQLLDEQGPHLKAIFNTGAGVDAILKLQLPPHVPVIRLDDAGMSATRLHSGFSTAQIDTDGVQALSVAAAAA